MRDGRYTVSGDAHKSKYGGPIGLAGLGSVLGAGGLLAWAGIIAATDTAQPISDPVDGDVIIVRPLNPDNDPDNGPDTDPVNVDGQVDNPMDPPQSPDDDPVIKPIDPVRPQTDPVHPVNPPAHEHSEPDRVFLIVKVKGSPEFDKAVRLFKKDPKAAKTAFEAFIRKYPEFKGMRLARGSYSGEAQLEYEFPSGRNASEAAVRALQKKLNSVEGVAYCDIDYVVHPTKED